jgi:hypothetical protein
MLVASVEIPEWILVVAADGYVRMEEEFEDYSDCF